jgi:hypothetical protein
MKATTKLALSSTLALMLAGPAWAQTTGGGTDGQANGGMSAGASGSMAPDSMASGTMGTPPKHAKKKHHWKKHHSATGASMANPQTSPPGPGTMDQNKQ